MTAWSHCRGHRTVWHDGQWCYADTLEPTRTAAERPCPKCGVCVERHAPDPCLGQLPGVVAACCGHGVRRGYILYADGTRAD